MAFRYRHRKYFKGVGPGNVQVKGSPLDGRWAYLWGCNDGGIWVKHLSNVMLLHPADKSQNPCPLLASASVPGLTFLISSMYCITLCLQLPVVNQQPRKSMVHSQPNGRLQPPKSSFSSYTPFCADFLWISRRLTKPIYTPFCVDILWLSERLTKPIRIRCLR